MKREAVILLITAGLFFAAIIYGGIRQQAIKASSQEHEDLRTERSVKKVNSKQDANAEALRAISRELGIDTTGLKIFNKHFLDSLDSITILPNGKE